MNDFLQSLVASSWQASIVAGLVCLTSVLFRRWLSASVRYGLWFLVILRLIGPVFPASFLNLMPAVFEPAPRALQKLESIVQSADLQGAVAALNTADGHLITRSEKGSGSVALIEATHGGYRENVRFNPPDRSRQNSWAPPRPQRQTLPP